MRKRGAQAAQQCSALTHDHGLSEERVDRPVDDCGVSASQARVDPAYQGRGVGTALLQYVFRAAREQLKCDVIWCDARLATAGWYERRGMHKFGQVFYKGEIEYIRMKANVT